MIPVRPAARQRSNSRFQSSGVRLRSGRSQRKCLREPACRNGSRAIDAVVSWRNSRRSILELGTGNLEPGTTLLEFPTSRSGSGPVASDGAAPRSDLDHAVQVAERADAHLAARGLGLDHDVLARERVAALARRSRWLLHGLELHQTVEVELPRAVLAEVGRHDVLQRVEHFT